MLRAALSAEELLERKGVGFELRVAVDARQ